MKLWQKFLLALGSIPAALGAVDYDLQLTQSGLNLAADGLEVVSFARIIAVEPPWGHKYFFNAYTKLEQTQDGNKIVQTYKSNDFSHGRFVENTIGDGIVSHVFVVFKPLHDTHNLRYWKYAINNESVMGRILARCTKKTTMMTNLVTKDFLNQSIPCPSAQEQDKIASLLDTISKRIELQKLYVESLKKYKRGVVRSLLSPEDCKLKNAQWSRDTIGNLGSFIKGAPLSKADISKTGTPFILYGELYTTYHEVITSVVRKTESEVDSVYRSIVGDVLIPTSGETPEEISTASCVMLPGVILAGDLNIFRSSKVDGRIMSYILNHIVNGSIARVAQGKSIVHVQASEISKIEISYPDPETQNRIIKVLEAISSRVESCEKELDNLTKLRSSLMQQLFI